MKLLDSPFLQVTANVTCQNLPQDWQNKDLEINTHDSKCIVLYEKENCDQSGLNLRFYKDQSILYFTENNSEESNYWSGKVSSYMLCNW